MRNLKSFWQNSAKPHLKYAKARVGYAVQNIFYEGEDYRINARLKFLPFISSVFLAMGAGMGGIYHVSSAIKQDTVLENTYWDNADATDAKTANADRAKIKAIITHIHKIEKQLENPEALGPKDRKNLQSALEISEEDATYAILDNLSLPEKELAQYAMSYNFNIYGEKPSSPEVFKALREMQYQSSPSNSNSNAVKFNRVVSDYNRAGEFMHNPVALFGMFGAFVAFVIPFSREKKAKPNLRDFKPKLN